MTKEETENAIKVMQAYVDGKQIEYCELREKEWRLCGNPLFDWNAFNYRISKNPQYRPFQNPLECLQEMQKHNLVGWILYNNDYHCITSIGERNIYFSNHDALPFTEACKICRFIDSGEPFGIKI